MQDRLFKLYIIIIHYERHTDSLSYNLPPFSRNPKLGNLTHWVTESAMDSQDGNQQAHLVLAHKRFLLTHPDVQDIEKVRLKEEVFAMVKADGT